MALRIVVDPPADRDINALREEFRAAIESGNAARLRELIEWFVYGNSLRDVAQHPVRPTPAPQSPVRPTPNHEPSPSPEPDPDWLL